MAKPIQDANGVWHCNPPQYNIIPGQGHVEITGANELEIDDLCSPYLKTTQGGNAMPIRAEKQKTAMKKRKVANRVRGKRKLSATGCSSCGSSFTGDSKPCSCGRNPGGSCQCNSGGSSARMGQGVSQPISMPVMASASGKRPNGMPLARENRDCDKRCPHCPDGDISMNNGPCNHRGECCDKRVFTPQGLAPGQRLAFPNNQAIKKYDMLKFSNFVSKVKSNGRKNFVNPTNFGAAEDETFAYNPRVIKEFSSNTKGFLDKSDLNNYSF